MVNLYNLKSRQVRVTLSAIFFVLSALGAFAQVENIDNDKLALLLSKGIPIIDIREEKEWNETGIVPASRLITFFDSDGQYDAKKWLKELKTTVKRDQPLILICRSGRRSLIVANFLSRDKKFPKVYNVEDGIVGWKNDNLETVAVRN